MPTRRKLLVDFSAITFASLLPLNRAQAQEEVINYDIEFPPFDAITNPKTFGYDEPTKEQKELVAKIVRETPKGPTPLAVARSFIDRFSTSDPEIISQWPKAKAWNPLIVEFFTATSTPVNNDMIAWCAAFANWCIQRNGRTGTRNASSQSFLEQSASKFFARTDNPEVGDLAVWTCYDKSGNSLGLGHVAFISGPRSATAVMTISGNVSKDGKSSIIAEKPISTADRDITRTVNGTRVPCTMRLSAFLKIL